MADDSRTRRLIALLRLLSHLPLPLLQGAGALLGLLYFLIPNRERRIAARNLELCFPELSKSERHRLLRRSLMEMGKSLTELPVVWYGDLKRVKGLVRQVSGLDDVQAALARGKGVMLASPHLGCWEMGGLYISTLGKVTTLYRPPRQAYLDAILVETRERMGATLVPTDRRGVRELFQTLKRGEIVGILPDQDPREAGVFAPFFGIPASTMTLVPSLARKSGATVLIGFGERLPWGRGYHIRFLPVDTAINGEDEVAAATALNEAVEHAIRLFPSQYQWSYRRFRTRPEGEPSVY